jgi:hypothetical protein
MALTLKVEQRLENVHLIEFYENDPERWRLLARSAYEFTERNFPSGAKIRHDDVAEMLKPLLEIDVPLKDFLAAKKLKQNYWIQDFCDLILDRTWNQIRHGGTLDGATE